MERDYGKGGIICSRSSSLRPKNIIMPGRSVFIADKLFCVEKVYEYLDIDVWIGNHVEEQIRVYL